MDNKKSRQMDAEMSAALFSERERFEMLFADHWKKVAVIGVAIALLVALAFVAWSLTNQAATRAAYAFADAADAPALEKALAEYGTRKGALAARERLVLLYVDAKNYDGALKQIRLVINAPEADAACRSRAAVTEALVLEVAGKTKEAAAAFSKIAGNANYKTAARIEAAVSGARLIAGTDPDGAAALLETASRLNPDSQVAAKNLSVAKSMLLALENGELGPKPKAKKAKVK